MLNLWQAWTPFTFVLLKKKEEKRGVNVTEFLEVDVASPFPLKSAVKIASLRREDETGVNQVENKKK